MEVAYQFPDNVMTDPSLLASQRTAWNTLDIVPTQDHLKFYLPRTFYDFLQERGYQAFTAETEEQPPLIRYYAQYSDLPNLSDVAGMVPEPFTPFDAHEYEKTHRDLYTALAETLPYSRYRPAPANCVYGNQNNELVDTVFEELVFLLERSGWVSRTKRVVNDAIDAGIHFIEVNEGRVDEFLGRYTKDIESVKKDILKEMGKWIAVSTTGIAVGLMGEPLHGLISAKAAERAINTSLLFVFDP